MPDHIRFSSGTQSAQLRLHFHNSGFGRCEGGNGIGKRRFVALARGRGTRKRGVGTCKFQDIFCIYRPFYRKIQDIFCIHRLLCCEIPIIFCIHLPFCREIQNIFCIHLPFFREIPDIFCIHRCLFCRKPFVFHEKGLQFRSRTVVLHPAGSHFRSHGIQSDRFGVRCWESAFRCRPNERLRDGFEARSSNGGRAQAPSFVDSVR